MSKISFRRDMSFLKSLIKCFKKKTEKKLKNEKWKRYTVIIIFVEIISRWGIKGRGEIREGVKGDKKYLNELETHQLGPSHREIDFRAAEQPQSS